MNHQLQTGDLQNFESKTQLAGQFGQGVNKSLNIRTIVTITNQIVSNFTVEHNKQEVFLTDNLESAIVRYNQI